MKLSSIVCASFVALALTASGALAGTTIQGSKQNGSDKTVTGGTTAQSNGCPNGQAAGTVNEGSENGSMISYRMAKTKNPCATPGSSPTPSSMTGPVKGGTEPQCPPDCLKQGTSKGGTTGPSQGSAAMTGAKANTDEDCPPNCLKAGHDTGVGGNGSTHAPALGTNDHLGSEDGSMTSYRTGSTTGKPPSEVCVPPMVSVNGRCVHPKQNAH